MIQLEIELIKRKKYLEKTIEIANAFLQTAPSGKLRCSYCRDKERYYLLDSYTDKNGIYINKKNEELISKLAQKGYASNYIKDANSEIKLINKYLLQRSKSSPEQLYDNLSSTRQSLVNPYAVSNEAYSEWWQNQPYKTSTKNPEEKVFPTNRGDFVRSGAEAFIANIYHELNIPYRYECLVKLKNGKVKSPDFTALNVKKRIVIYHEYMGMIDDPDYRKKNLIKLDDYRESGIYTGKNLILTFSGDGSQLNVPALKTQLKEIFEID